MKNKLKGQLTITAILALLIGVVIFSAIEPTLTQTINSTINSVGPNTVTANILNLIVPMVAIGLLVGFLYYIFPAREQQQGY